MTKRVGRIAVIEDEPDQVCCRCNALTDTRDVLGNGTRVCLDCATPAEQENYGRRMFAQASKVIVRSGYDRKGCL
jgi:hypothetical protein